MSAWRSLSDTVSRRTQMCSCWSSTCFCNVSRRICNTSRSADSCTQWRSHTICSSVDNIHIPFTHHVVMAMLRRFLDQQDTSTRTTASASWKRDSSTEIFCLAGSCSVQILLFLMFPAVFLKNNSSGVKVSKYEIKVLEKLR